MKIKTKNSSRFISIILSVMLILSLIPVNAVAADDAKTAEEFSSWSDVALTAEEETDYILDGTDYTVNTAKGLAYIADIVNKGNSLDGATVTLANDIDLTQAGVTNYSGGSVNAENRWIPIGKNLSNSFSGTFDGGSHTVSGLYINNTSSYRSGLFGLLKNATVKNLNVEGSVIANTYAGGIAGESVNSNIENCVNNVTAQGRFYIGGIVGSGSGTISHCYNTESITGGFGIGGIIGYNTGSVKNCYNTGDINSGNYAGGIAGFNSNIVENCYNIGSVESNYIKGGVIGYDKDGTITNTYFLKTDTINSTLEGIGYDETYNPNSSEPRSENEFKSGEVAYLLQGDDETQIWGQLLAENGDKYPKFTNKSEEKVCKVLFINDNTEYASIYANQGSKISEPADEPSKVGNTFEGWYKEESLENQWNFDSDTVTQDTSLYSKWEITNYAITYTLENMTADDQPDSVIHNTATDILIKPADGYKAPQTVTVKRDGEELSADTEYTFSTTAEGLKISFPEQTVTGNLEIIAAGIPLSNNTDLTGLAYEFGETRIDLTPEQIAEAGTDEGVTVVLHHGTQDGTEITLYPEAANDKDSVTAQGGTLTDGRCTCTVTVTAEDRKTQKTYKVNFTVNEDHAPDQIVIENEKSATCTEEGSYDEVIYCIICKDEIARETIKTDALGHTWGEWELTKAPTATEKGEETRTCQVCDDKETREVAPDSTAPVISGVGDGSFYNEEKVVTVEDTLLDTVTVNGEAVELDENNSFKLNTADGVYAIVATDKAGNSTSVTVTMDTTAPAINSGSSLKEGGTYCQHFSGTFDEKNIDRITVNGTEMIIDNADTDQPGFTMDSSSANKPIYGELTIEVTDKAGNNLTVHVTLNAEHPYGEPLFIWAEDGKSATAKFTCSNDESHVEEIEASVTNAVKTPATCTEEGITTYTATVDFNGKTYTETKDVTDITKTEHTPEIKNAKDATCTEEGYTGDKVCSVCEEVLEKGEVIPKTEHHYENGKCITCGALEFILGDVDLDGVISIKDVTLIQLYCAHFKSLTEEQMLRADVDKDEHINVKDATLIQLYLAHLIAEFEQ